MLGANIISTDLWRGVAPFMARSTPLSQMGVGLLPPDIGGLSSDVDVVRWLGKTLEVQRDIDEVARSSVFPIPGCPLMRPEPGFVKFVSILFQHLWSSFLPLILSSSRVSIIVSTTLFVWGAPVLATFMAV